MEGLDSGVQAGAGGHTQVLSVISAAHLTVLPGVGSFYWQHLSCRGGDLAGVCTPLCLPGPVKMVLAIASWRCWFC